MKKRTIIILAIVVIVVLVAVVGLGSKKDKGVKVTLEKVKRMDLTSIVSASGEIKPKKNVNISALIPGRIVKIGV
jgi:HlyD family secretion protein